MIRLATSQDFKFIYDLYMHPQINPFLLYEMMDADNFLPIFNDLTRQAIKYVYSSDIENTGMFKLIPLQHRNHHVAYLGGLAIHPEFAGKGEGTKMVHEIVELAGEKGFLRIELSVSSANTRAIRLYEKAGFQKEGLLRKLTHLQSENRFIDEVLMAHLL